MAKATVLDCMGGDGEATAHRGSDGEGARIPPVSVAERRAILDTTLMFMRPGDCRSGGCCDARLRRSDRKSNRRCREAAHPQTAPRLLQLRRAVERELFHPRGFHLREL